MMYSAIRLLLCIVLCAIATGSTRACVIPQVQQQSDAADSDPSLMLSQESAGVLQTNPGYGAPLTYDAEIVTTTYSASLDFDDSGGVGNSADNDTAFVIFDVDNDNTTALTVNNATLNVGVVVLLEALEKFAAGAAANAQTDLSSSSSDTSDASSGDGMLMASSESDGSTSATDGDTYEIATYATDQPDQSGFASANAETFRATIPPYLRANV